MRILGACSLGGAGHFRPLLPLLDAALARGDETLVVATPGLQHLVEGAGHRFVAGGEPNESAIAPIREALPVLPPEEASVLGNRDLFGRLATEAMLPTMTRVADEWRPDLVFREPCEYASAVVTAARLIPSAQVAISLADVEWGSIEAAADVLESHRAGMVDELRTSPYLTAFPPSLDRSPFGDTRRLRGREARPPAPLPDWWDGSDQPLVYVTFGSVIPLMSFAPSAFASVIRTVGQLDARVLFTVGRVDPSALEPAPVNVHVEQWVDQADVLAEAQLVVCHGGSGTVLGALAAGVPMVVLPHFGDQFANARRIAESGAGVTLDAGREDDGRRRPAIALMAPRIGSSAALVLSDGSFRRAARRVGLEMESLSPADSILEELGSVVGPGELR
ncbi:MAG: glycosyltransferase [Acidimicrobiales bacterium]